MTNPISQIQKAIVETATETFNVVSQSVSDVAKALGLTDDKKTLTLGNEAEFKLKNLTGESIRLNGCWIRMEQVRTFNPNGESIQLPITPEKLEGMSPEVLQNLIDSIKDKPAPKVGCYIEMHTVNPILLKKETAE